MRVNALGHRLWGASLSLLALVLALAVNSILTAPAMLRQNASPAQRGPPFAPAHMQQQQQQFTPVKQQQQQAPLSRRSPGQQQNSAPSSSFSVRTPAPNQHSRWSKPSIGMNSPANRPNELRGAPRVGASHAAAMASAEAAAYDDGPEDAAPPADEDEYPMPDEEGEEEEYDHGEEELPATEPPAEAPPAPSAPNGKASVNEAFSLARDLMNGLQGDGQAKSAGFNFNNQQATIKVGNTKKVNVNQINNHVAPTITNSHFGRLDLGSTPSLVVPNKNSQVKFASVPGQVQGSMGDGAGGKGEEPKVKATPEQKELKKKLLELADKATSSPATEDADLLRFNTETGQIEPAPVDPMATEYKQKLQDAIKALSAKKLPTERLKEALEGFDVHAPSAPEALKFQAAPQFQGNYQGLVSPPYAQPPPPPHAAPDADGGEEENMEIEPPADDEELPPPDDEFGEEEEELPPPDDYDEELPPPDFEEEEEGQEGQPPADDGEFEPELAPEPEVDPLLQVREILADRLNRISDLLYFRPEFLNQLLQIDDNLLTPIEAEFKRMILCNSDEQFCMDDLSKYVNPDGLLPAPLSEDELAPLPPPEDEEQPQPEEEEEAEPEAEPEFDDGGLIPDPPSPPPVPSPFLPIPPLPIAPPAGARHYSHSKTSVNYQYDHAHANADFGDGGAPEPVVQHSAMANARSWINGKPGPLMGVRRSGSSDRRRVPFGVRSAGPAISSGRRPLAQHPIPPNELRRRKVVAPRQPAVRRSGPSRPSVPSQLLPPGRGQPARHEPNVRSSRRDSPPQSQRQPPRYQQQTRPAAVVPSQQARFVSPSQPQSVSRQQQQQLVRQATQVAQPPRSQAPQLANRYVQQQQTAPSRPAAGQHPAMQAVAPQSPARVPGRFGSNKPIGK